MLEKGGNTIMTTVTYTVTTTDNNVNKHFAVVIQFTEEINIFLLRSFSERSEIKFFYFITIPGE